MGEYSSAEEIAKYNKLAAKQNAIINKFNEETKGLNILEKQAELLARVDKHESAISKLTEADEIVKAFALNYNVGESTLLHMEQAIMGDMGSMGFGLLKFISDIGEGVYSLRAKGTMEEAYGQKTEERRIFDDLQKDEDDNLAIADYFQNTYAAHLNYKESLKNHMESTLPLNIPWEDVSIDNIGEVSSQLLANNSFSILSALTYGGAVAYAVKGTAKYTIPQATRMLTQTFFAVEGGAKLSEMELAQQNAIANIAALEKALPHALTQDDRLEILNQIDAQNQA